METDSFFVSLFLKQHYRLVALQKTSVTHELEQVHTALAELEKELITSRSENDRLRHLSNSIRQSTTSSMSSTRSSSSSSRSLMTPSTTNTTPNSHARIHVSRTGSIAITRTDEEGNTLPFSPNRSTATSSASSVAAPSAPAMIPLPSGGNASGNVRVRANRFGSMDISRGGSLTTPTEKNESSATALANDGSDPWSLGSQTNITSIRRGTYFGEFLVWKCWWWWWCGWGGVLLLFLTCFFSFGGFDQERTNKAKPMENDDGNERDRRLIDDSSRRHRRIKSRGNMRSLFFIH